MIINLSMTTEENKQQKPVHFLNACNINTNVKIIIF